MNRSIGWLEANKRMSQRAGPERTPVREMDQLATICVARLPEKIKRAIYLYGTEGAEPLLFVRIIFKNGHKVAFRADWKEFVAECILVHDLPPVEIDDDG